MGRLLASLLCLGLLVPAGRARAQPGPAAPLRIELGSAPLRTGVKRMGINLGSPTFYDSGQMLRNLVARNPGFEAGAWQSILRCKTVAGTTCTEDNPYTVWPAGFLDGARFQVLSGRQAGVVGTVEHSSAAIAGQGVTLRLDHAGPAAGDFVLVRMPKPGHADAGWWIETTGGGRTASETRDLAPGSPGHQALRVEAAGPGAAITVRGYFDSLEGHSFVHLHGTLTLRFRAKPLAGTSAVALRLERLDTRTGLRVFLDRTLPLQAGWHDYTLPVRADDLPGAIGPVRLGFVFTGTDALLDDVSLDEPAGPGNPTVFRDAVVRALRALHPGILRFMDSGTGFAASLDTLLAPPGARLRSGHSTRATLAEDVPIGLGEELALAAAVGAEPWIALPAGFSPDEMRRLVASLRSGGWTARFPTVHLELGNEQWNQGSFAGSTLHDPAAYARRAAEVFRAARAAPGFEPARFDLVLGSWNASPWWTAAELEAAGHAADTVSVAPYLFDNFNDARSDEAIFGPMLAQPEALDSRPGGLVRQQAEAARAKGTRLAVYETNLGALSTTSATLGQADLDRAIPSLGGALTVADHMLRMLRDDGVVDQCFFALAGFRNDFRTPGGSTLRLPLWGATVDMGGATGRVRPSFLALQAINQAILPTLLPTRVSGGPEPTWDQPKSANDGVELRGAHGLDVYAFADGPRRSLVLFNLQRTAAIDVQPAVPAGLAVERIVLNAASLAAGNERDEQVRLEHTAWKAGSAALRLPPHSLTVLRWAEPPAR